MNFDTIITCPYCGEKNPVNVHGASKDKAVFYSTEFPIAHDWYIKGDEVVVTIKCVKCSKTSESRYTLNGEKKE